MQSHMSSNSLCSYEPDNFQFPEIPSSPVQIGCSSFKHLTSSLLIRRLSNRLAKNHEPKDIEVISFKRWNSHCDSPPQSPTTQSSSLVHQTKPDFVPNTLVNVESRNDDSNPTERKCQDPADSNSPDLSSRTDLTTWNIIQNDYVNKPNAFGSQSMDGTSEASNNVKSDMDKHFQVTASNETITKYDPSIHQFDYQLPRIEISNSSSTVAFESSPVLAWPSPNSGVTSPGNFKKILRDRYLHSQTQKQPRNSVQQGQLTGQISDQSTESYEENTTTNLVSKYKLTYNNLMDILLELFKALKRDCDPSDFDRSEQLQTQAPVNSNPLLHPNMANDEETLVKPSSNFLDSLSTDNLTDIKQQNTLLNASLSYQDILNNPGLLMHLIQTYQSLEKQQPIHEHQSDNQEHGSPDLLKSTFNESDGGEADSDSRSNGCARMSRAWSLTSNHHFYHHQRHNLYRDQQHGSPKRRVLDSSYHDSSCVTSPLTIPLLPFGPLNVPATSLPCNKPTSMAISSAMDYNPPQFVNKLQRLSPHSHHKTAFSGVSRIRKCHYFGSTAPPICSPNSAVEPLIQNYPRSAVPHHTESTPSPCSAKYPSSIPIPALAPLSSSVFVFPPPSPLRVMSNSVPNVLSCPSLFTPSSTSDGHLGSSSSSSISSFSSMHSTSSSASSSSAPSNLGITGSHNIASSTDSGESTEPVGRSDHPVCIPVLSTLRSSPFLNSLHQLHCGASHVSNSSSLSDRSICNIPTDLAQFGSSKTSLSKVTSYSPTVLSRNPEVKPKRHRNSNTSNVQHRESAGNSCKSTGKIGRSSNGAHVCGICSRQFSRSDMLVRHAHVHTGHRPFGCSVCGQSFSRSDHLSTHQRTHTGQRPYRCALCSYSASRRDMITRHLRVHQRRGQLIPSAAMETVMPSSGSNMHKVKPKAPAFSSSYPRTTNSVQISIGHRGQGTRLINNSE